MMDSVDIVYVVGQGAADVDNAPLRWSLRSLAKFATGVGRIVVAGYPPAWLSDDVVSVKIRDRPGFRKNSNIALAAIAGARAAGISGPFLYSSDDHYLLRRSDMREWPRYFRGTINDRFKERRRSINPDVFRYWSILSDTRKFLESKGLPGERRACLHMDTWMDAKYLDEAEALVIEARKIGIELEPTCVFNALFERDNRNAEYVDYRRDWKAKDSFGCKRKVDQGAVMFTTAPIADKKRDVAKWMNSIYGDPCKYEKGYAEWLAKSAQAPQGDDSSPDDAIDAVFVIGTGSNNKNEELRYALRNLDAHCKFIRNVYICGECPPWVDRSEVTHLQWPDRFHHAKDANIIDKLRHACEYPGIAKRILFCSDDQFQTRECSWDDFAPRWLKQFDPSDTWYRDKHRVWHNRLRKTLEREVQRRKAIGMNAKNVFYWQPHIWMPMDRDVFLDYARWCGYEKRDDTIIASGYYNFANTKGRQCFDHVFLESGCRTAPKETHVAYHDPSYHAAMVILKKMFPSRCRFECGSAALEPPRPRPHQPKTAKSDPRQARDEAQRISDVVSRVRREPVWRGLLFEVSKAEELRLKRADGWRIVWDDIIRRWEKDTDCGRNRVSVTTPRSHAAARVIEGLGFHASSASASKPRPSAGEMRRAIKAALRRRTGNGILL